MSEPAVISVKGVGNVSVPPDMTVVTFQMASLHLEYARSVDHLNQRVAALRNALSKTGVEPTALKTTSFEVDDYHEYEDQKRVFKGWKSEHSLRLELPVDRDRLNQVLGAIAAAGCRLGKVIRMDYGWSEIRFQSASYALAETMEDAAEAPDIEPDDVDASDSVTAVWELLEG